MVRRMNAGLWSMVCLGLLAAPMLHGQAAPAPTPRPLVPENPQKVALQADVDRLLKLAEQLKVTVDKTRRDELSMEVIRQADEIEKLARSTRSRIH